MQPNNKIAKEIMHSVLKGAKQLNDYDLQNDEPISSNMKLKADRCINSSSFPKLDSKTYNKTNSSNHRQTVNITQYVSKNNTSFIQNNLNIENNSVSTKQKISNNSKIDLNITMKHQIVSSLVHQVLNLTEQKSLITTTKPTPTIYQDPLYATHSPEFLKIPIFKSFIHVHDRMLRSQRLLWMIEPLEKAKNYLSYIIKIYENLKKIGIKYEVCINDEGKSSLKITDPNKVFHEAQKHFDELQNLKEIKYDLIKVLTAIKERVANVEEWETPYYQK